MPDELVHWVSHISHHDVRIACTGDWDWQWDGLPVEPDIYRADGGTHWTHELDKITCPECRTAYLDNEEAYWPLKRQARLQAGR